MEKKSVAVLGATGATAFGWTAQLLIGTLENHPWFKLGALIAEDPAHAGKKFGEVCPRWFPETRMPDDVANMRMVAADPEALKREGDISVVISCLLPAPSRELDARLATAFPVVSESPGLRDQPDIPLIVPEINADHLSIIPTQQKARGWKGYVVSNPVCTITVLCLSLKPIIDRIGVDNVIVTTLQALSGAGPTGIPSLAIIDNLIPYIPTEEEKLMDEGRKILGCTEDNKVVPCRAQISGTCTRVGVSDGHIGSMFVQCARPASLDEIKDALATFRGPAQELGLPSAPKQPVHVTDAIDRPQPRLDRMTEGGMSVVVGRIRPDPVLPNGIKYVVAGHNKIRGTYGNTLLNAELLAAKGMLG